LPIAPVPRSVTRERRCTAQLIFCDVGPIPAQAGVVGQLAPGNRVLLLTHAQEATERHYRVSDVAADLLDHQPLDAADVVALRIVDGRALHAIALDQGLSSHHSLVSHDSFPLMGIWLSNVYRACRFGVGRSYACVVQAGR